MPSLNASNRGKVSRASSHEMYVKQNSTALVDTLDIQAAVNSIDDILEANASTLNPAVSVIDNILAGIAEPFKTNSTAAQRMDMVLAIIKEKRENL